MKTPKYTINQFRKEFANDDVCLDRLFAMRYKSQPCCPQCSQETTFKRIPGRRSYQCSDSHCQYQLYPTAGTIFEKTRTSLADWFYAIYLMTSTRNGVSAKEIERQIGVTYKCAFRMGHQIRKLMDMSKDNYLLSGIVEADETYVGGKVINKHLNKRKSFKEENNMMTPIVAMVERNGRVVTKVTDNTKSSTILPLIIRNVERSARLITDAATCYNLVGRMYDHHPIKHMFPGSPEKNYITVGHKHTNSVEGFFSHLKRTIAGTHIRVSVQHLQAYADECAFRYTHRKSGQLMFFKILDQVKWN